MVRGSEETQVEEGKIKLNLMCGDKIWDGFINVDFVNDRGSIKPDVECDVRKLPFPDDYADEVQCIHGIEHFYLWEVDDVVKEWRRVLKPRGKITIETPDIEKILGLWVNGASGLAKTWFGLYGDQASKDPAMVHKWCYHYDQLHDLLVRCGFHPARISYKKRAKHHFWFRDMRVEAYK